VVRESYLRWKKEEEGIVDDITCIIVFLDVKLTHQDPSPTLLLMEQQAASREAALQQKAKLDNVKASDFNELKSA
jgi:hypothetical protein